MHKLLKRFTGYTVSDSVYQNKEIFFVVKFPIVQQYTFFYLCAICHYSGPVSYFSSDFFCLAFTEFLFIIRCNN